MERGYRMAAMTVLIGGVDKTSLLKARSLRVTLRGEGETSCGFSMNTDAAYIPQAGQTVQVLDGTDVRFGGRITTSRINKYRGSSELEITISCEGYNNVIFLKP